MNNGYASIDLNGQQVGLKFGMACFTEMMSKPLPDTILGNLEYAADLIFAAYKNNCLVKREAPSLDYQPFYDFVEDASVDAAKMDVITGLMTIFTESKFVKPEPVKPQEAAATKKKNGQQTTLKPSVMVS